jgi:hypothetical protein
VYNNYWLQSFISQYSLQQWMTAIQDHQAQLTLDEILAKPRQVERLMNINGWTDQANRDYHELFGVDKSKEAMRRNKSPPQLLGSLVIVFSTFNGTKPVSTHCPHRRSHQSSDPLMPFPQALTNDPTLAARRMALLSP